VMGNSWPSDHAAVVTDFLLVGPLTSLQLSTTTPVVTSGTRAIFSAIGADANGNSLGDVASDATFSIAPAATDPDGASATGASCDSDQCSATAAGNYTVTATDGSVSATATLTVEAGPVAALSQSPIPTLLPILGVVLLGGFVVLRRRSRGRS
jgi:hypothetical protein